jgi:hypothetical protein
MTGMEDVAEFPASRRPTWLSLKSRSCPAMPLLHRRHQLTPRKHSDNLNNLVIASVSLGAERTFILSPRMPSRSGKSGRGNAAELSGEVLTDLEERKNVKWRYVAFSVLEDRFRP